MSQSYHQNNDAQPHLLFDTKKAGDLSVEDQSK